MITRALARSQAVRYAARLRAADADAIALVHVAVDPEKFMFRVKMEQSGIWFV